VTEHSADLGRYELVEELGRGGMGVVYLARHVALSRLVAIKKLEIIGTRDDLSFAERFLREARMTSALSHPNVVTVHDFFEHEGAAYIAMEYAAGGSLRPLVGQMDPGADRRRLGGGAGWPCPRGTPWNRASRRQA
jgi:serine/threonine protein kinase